MARITKPLTVKEIEAAKPDDKTYKLMDGGGLYLQITPSGSKAWRFRYRVNGRERTMSLGSYNDVDLAKARALRDMYRSKVAMGIDPLEEKAKEEEAQRLAEAKKLNTWRIVLDEYLEWKQLSGEMNQNTFKRLKQRFEAETAHLDNTPFTEVTDKDIRAILLKMANRGAIESARRFYTQLLYFYEYAREFGYLPKGVPTIPEMISKKHLLPVGKVKKQSYPIITDEAELGQLLRDIDDAPCEYPTRQMLKILPHLAVRPKNIREMEWSEIDWDDRVWIIPAEKMKAGVTHVVPLTDYVLEVLTETSDKYSSGRKYVFPSFRTGKVVSEVTPNTCLSRIDEGKWKGKVVTHSFRGIFSTIANQKSNFASEVIDKALAHSLSNAVEAAYNRADYLEQRRELHEWWTNYLLGVKNG